MRFAAAALAVLLIGALPAAGQPAEDADASPSPIDAAAGRSAIEEAVASYGRALDTPERDRRLEGFRRAERLFARVAADAPANPALQTNLGNAALQAEHLGTAVLAYRRALA